MEQSFPFNTKEINNLFKNFFSRVFNLDNLSELNTEQLKEYLFEVNLPCLYKFISAFVYLNDNNAIFEYEE